MTGDPLKTKRNSRWILLPYPTAVTIAALCVSYKLHTVASSVDAINSRSFFVLYVITILVLIAYGLGVVCTRWSFSDASPTDRKPKLGETERGAPLVTLGPPRLFPRQPLVIDKASWTPDTDHGTGTEDLIVRLTDASIAFRRARNLYLPLATIVVFPMTANLLWSATTGFSTVIARAEWHTHVFLWPTTLALVILMFMSISMRPETAARSSLSDMWLGQGVMVVLFFLLFAIGNPSVTDVAFVWWNTVLLVTVFLTGVYAALLPARAFGAVGRYGAATEALMVLGLAIASGIVVGWLPTTSNAGQIITKAIEQIQHIAWPAVLVLAIVILEPVIVPLLKDMGTIKAFGTEVTFKREKTDLKVPITSFEELMKVVKDLIANTSKGDTARFMAYTPALGYLARTASEWDALSGVMYENDQLQIICLAEKQLKAWHYMFKGRRTVRGEVTEALITEANTAAESILEQLPEPTNKYYFPKDLDELPNYYAFANKNTAIIVVPFSLPVIPSDCIEGIKAPEVKFRGPVPDGANTLQFLEDLIGKVNAATGPASDSLVEMFGIVTNEERIVKYVHDLLDSQMKPKKEELCGEESAIAQSRR